jgi:phosphomannomutase / phosphoglucomutase
MERLFTVLTATAVALILTASLGVYVTSKIQVVQAKSEASQAAAKALANSISQQIRLLNSALDKIAQDPGIVQAASRSDITALQNAASTIEKYVPATRKIRFFIVGTIEPDTVNTPKMGYGDIDMVKSTFQENPLPEIQGEMGPDRHLAITRRVMNGNYPSAVILASLGFDFIAKSLQESLIESNYIEVRQAKLVLASGGEKNEADEDLEEIKIGGTNWTVNYIDNSNSVGGELLKIALFILLPIFIALIVFYTAYKRFSVTLAQDQDWLLAAFKDLLTERLQGNYPVTLKGMNAVIASMVRIKKDVEKLGVNAFLPETDSFELEGYLDELSDEDKIKAISKNVARKLPEIRPGIVISDEEDTIAESPPPFEQPEPVAQTPQEPVNAPDPKSAIFRAYDIRGIVGQTLTEEVVFDIGRALGAEAKEANCSSLVVGRDGRLSSPAVSQALCQGIAAAGCNIIDIGMVPTPVLYFVVQHTDGRSGVMITGSHNPPEYNGLKMVIKGETLAGERIQKLKQRIDQQQYANVLQGFIEQNGMFINEYIGTVTEDIQLTRAMKVAVDCGNGAAGELAPTLLKTLGCEVIELNCEVDGNFPNHHPDPSKPENLVDLIAAVKQNHADLGIAFDGDGDRLGLVDSNGKIIWPDRQMMLYAKDVLAGKPGAEIIYDVKCSRNLPEQIKKFGGKPLMWKTGHSHMKAKLKETGAKLAGEMSGHIFFNDRWFGFDDALYTAARLLQILSEETRSSAEVFADFPESLSTPELNVELTEGENFKFIDDMFANASFTSGKVTSIDGMRMDFSDGWGLVRASNTTPSLVIRFEADNQEAMAKIQEQFRQLMLKVKPDIKLPF